MKLHLWMPLLLAVATLSCRSGVTPPTSSTPTEEAALGTLILAPGQARTLRSEGVVIGFRLVDGDSRCPIDVRCVWEGEAKALLFVRPLADREPVEFSLEYPGHGPGSASSRVVAGVRVTLIDVRPVADTRHPIAPGDYRIVLRVTREPS